MKGWVRILIIVEGWVRILMKVMQIRNAALPSINNTAFSLI
jgi:hypothetical protein